MISVVDFAFSNKDCSSFVLIFARRTCETEYIIPGQHFQTSIFNILMGICLRKKEIFICLSIVLLNIIFHYLSCAICLLRIRETLTQQIHHEPS